MNHDLVWGMKGGQPSRLMGQTPDITNWLFYNALKRPGGMGLLIWQIVAHGGGSMFFFQMCRSIGVCEKYHGMLMDHVRYEHTRVFREMQVPGVQLTTLLDAVLGTGTVVKVATAVDWDNWWALGYSTRPSCKLKYPDEVERYYQPLFELNTPVDTVSVEDDLEEYKIVVAKDQIVSETMHAIQSIYNL